MLPGGGHRGPVQAAGVVVELGPHFAQGLKEPLPVKGGQLADGADAQLPEGLGRRPAHIEQVAHGQGPDDFPEVVPVDHRGGVRLFIVAAQLGEHLVEGHPHRDGQAEAAAHLLPQPVGQGPGVAPEQVEGAGDIQPALVNAEGLHQIGVLLIEAVDLPGEVPVPPVVGGEEDQAGTFALGLPDGLGGLDPEGLGRLVFGQDNAMAAVGVAAHRHRPVAQLGPVQQLHRGVKAVQIAVKNDPVHGAVPPLPVDILIISLSARKVKQMF